MDEVAEGWAVDDDVFFFRRRSVFREFIWLMPGYKLTIGTDLGHQTWDAHDIVASSKFVKAEITQISPEAAHMRR